MARVVFVQYSSIDNPSSVPANEATIGEAALVGRDDPIARGERAAALLGVPQPVGFHVARRQLRLVLHELRDRIPDAAGVRSAEPLDDFLHLPPRDPEGDLVGADGGNRRGAT